MARRSASCATEPWHRTCNSRSSMPADSSALACLTTSNTPPSKIIPAMRGSRARAPDIARRWIEYGMSRRGSSSWPLGVTLSRA